jgi:signal transduction histidine kinase
VKSIMGLHHGTAEILSEIGKGTTVILRFPR